MQRIHILSRFVYQNSGLHILVCYCNINTALLTYLFKVEQVINGVESINMGDGEHEEVKQPRVTKAQKRRVSHRFLLGENSFGCCVFLPTCFD